MDPLDTEALTLVRLDAPPADCILAAGDVEDLDSLREWVSQLPNDSYGQILIEAASRDQIQPLTTPPAVSVTWVLRDRPHHIPKAAGECTIRAGQALARAVDGWLDEWLRADSPHARRFVFWIGAKTNPIMCDYWHR